MTRAAVATITPAASPKVANTISRMPLQRKAANNLSAILIPSVVHDVLRSPGQPLDSRERAFMEPRFAHNFANVRIHNDAKASASARALNASAYTVGSSVVFDSGKFHPRSAAGKKTLAHELAHVVQNHSLGRFEPLTIARPSSIHEREANAAADAILRGASAPTLSHADGMSLFRRTDEDLAFKAEYPRIGYSTIDLKEAYHLLKEKFYESLIQAVRGIPKAAFSAMRAGIRELPENEQKSSETLISLFEEIVGVIGTVIITVIGMAVGLGEGFVDVLKGLVGFVVGVAKLFGKFYDLMRGHDKDFYKYVDEIIAAAKHILPGLTKLTSEWLTKFANAPSDRQSIMIGELTGQILALIATFWQAGNKISKLPKFSDAVAAIRKGDVMIAIAVPAVARPTAVAATLGTGLMTVGGKGSGSGKLPSEDKPPDKPAPQLEKKQGDKPKPAGKKFAATPEQIKGIKKLFATPLDQAPENLGELWANTTNANDLKIVRTNTNMSQAARNQIRGYFNNHRRRFWRAIQSDSSAKEFFESLGFKFGDKGTAPVLELEDGTQINVDIDHDVEIRQDPRKALDKNNLRIVPKRENRTVLRLLHDLDPFQKR